MTEKIVGGGGSKLGGCYRSSQNFLSCFSIGRVFTMQGIWIEIYQSPSRHGMASLWQGDS